MSKPQSAACVGSSLLSFSSSSAPSFTPEEIASLKAGLAALRQQGGPLPSAAAAAAAASAEPESAAAATAAAATATAEDRDLGGLLYRAEAEETPDCRFTSQQQTYSQQYSSLYFSRLQQLRPHLQQTAQCCWGPLPIHNAIKDANRGVPQTHHQTLNPSWRPQGAPRV